MASDKGVVNIPAVEAVHDESYRAGWFAAMEYVNSGQISVEIRSPADGATMTATAEIRDCEAAVMSEGGPIFMVQHGTPKTWS